MRIETPRQSIRRLTPDDAPFILELLNDPAFLRYIGFAFLPQFRSMGYGRETAQAVLAHARQAHGLTHVLSITSPDNDRSIALLPKMGFRFERFAALAEGEPDVKLFALALREDPA